RLTLLFLLIRLSRSSTLFPYTTLFRSRCRRIIVGISNHKRAGVCNIYRYFGCVNHPSSQRIVVAYYGNKMIRSCCGCQTFPGIRSEEHTSELQSRENLVCRLLLEKKKR